MNDATRQRAEIAALDAVQARLAGAADAQAAGRLSAEARRLAALLQAPVRVALVGREDGGKAEVLEFLVGVPVVEGPLRSAARPPLIVTHRAQPSLVAGWWDGRRVPQATGAVAQALAQRPEYLEFGLAAKTLEAFSFLVMPAGGDADLQRRNLRWLFPRADMVLWCKPAREPWLQEEARLWTDSPAALRETSLYVATEADGLMAETFAEAAARIARDTRGAFQKVIPISATKAVAAAPGGVVADARGWQESGARALLIALLDRSRAVRAAQAKAVEGLLAAADDLLAPPRPIPKAPVAAAIPIRAPLLDRARAPEEEKPQEAPAAAPAGPARPRRVSTAAARLSERLAGTAPAPAETPEAMPAAAPEPTADLRDALSEAEEPPPAALEPVPGIAEDEEEEPGADVEILRQFDAWIDDLLRQVDGDDFDAPAFLSNCARILDDLAFLIADRQAMRADTLWVNESVETAADRIGELRMDESEAAAAEAAALILQLSRDLCWTVAS